MDPVPTHYLDRDGAALAYQVLGNGPVDVVVFLEIGMHLDLCWTDPDIHRIFERSAAYSRTVHLQRRGFGLSDRVTYAPTVEQQADDVLAIMDAIGMRRATLVGLLGTAAPLALLAAKAPERVNGLVFYNPMFQGPRSSGELHGWTEAEAATLVNGYRQAFANWGSGDIIGVWDSELATSFNRRLMGLLERCSATPAAAQAYFDWLLEIDVRDVLKSVQVPARVLHLPSGVMPAAACKHAAELMPDGVYYELDPTPPGASIGQAWMRVAQHIEEVATGSHHRADLDRFLGTVLFTDVASSTELLARVGDTKYREMRADHERLVRLAVENTGGRLATVAGDGTMSVFDGPSKALRCAEIILEDAREIGVEVRCGVHTGELERDGLNVAGMAVHIGARVGAAADPGGVMVSQTVHDLVVGSGMTFESRGLHELRGVPGRWELFAVKHVREQSSTLPAEASMKTPIDKVALTTARRAPGLARAALRVAHAAERRRARIGG